MKLYNAYYQFIMPYYEYGLYLSVWIYLLICMYSFWRFFLKFKTEYAFGMGFPENAGLLIITIFSFLVFSYYVCLYWYISIPIFLFGLFNIYLVRGMLYNIWKINLKLEKRND